MTKRLIIFFGEQLESVHTPSAIAPGRRHDRVGIGGISQPGTVHCRAARVAKPEHSVFPVAVQTDWKQARIAGAGDS